MSGNSYPTINYFQNCHDGSVSPVHSQVGDSKSVQVLDISQPISYEPYLHADSRHYMRHIDPVYPMIRKDDNRVERKIWDIDPGSLNREAKSVLCTPLTTKMDPERYERNELETAWNSLELNKLQYDQTLTNRNDTKLSLNTIPVSPYLQVAERFVNELSEHNPSGNTGSHGPALLRHMLPATVVQGEQRGMAEDTSTSMSPKTEHKQPILEEEDGSLTSSPYPMNLYSAVSAPAVVEASVITNNILGRSTNIQAPAYHQDTSHGPSPNSSSNPSVHEVEVERFPCNSCDKIFVNKSKLSMHKRVHRKKAKFPQKLNTMGTAPGDVHKEEDGTSPDKKPPLETDGECAFICTTCGRGFRLKMALACHMRYHAEERSYTCAVCNQTFTSRWVRSPQLCDKCRHGPGAKPVAKPCRCERCGKCFKDARLLRDHTRSHTGERPFACQVCGKTFAQSGTLYRHKQVHSDSRPYRCTQCNKSYKLKGHLTVHIKSHSM